MKKPIPFGKYYLLERINVGGMAEVFRAKAYGVEGFERLLAVKRILPNIAEDHEFITMFIDEAKIAVQLNHANICQIFDLGVVDGAHFIAMEHVFGRDLRAIFERCRQKGEPMPIAQACFIVMKICEGLDYAHNKRDAQGREMHLVHRDVSPQNVLVSFEGEVKLIDFGIAKAAGKMGKTQAGILKGKFGYMSPEQVRGLPIDRRSDIFSTGIVLYELLTNERLFVGESDFSTLEKVRNVEILPPSTYNRKIPDELERIVLKALAKDVEDRYQNAIDLHDELQAFVYSAGEFYSRKDLAAWMKKVFAREIEEETAKLEQYRQIAPPEARPPTVGARPGAVHGQGGRRPTMAMPTMAPPPPPPVNGRARPTGAQPTVPPPVPPQAARASGPQPVVAPASAARTSGPPPAAARASGPDPAGSGADGLEWDDEELETQIYDTPGHEGAGAAAPAAGTAPAPMAAAPAAAIASRRSVPTATPPPLSTTPATNATPGPVVATPQAVAAIPPPSPELASTLKGFGSPAEGPASPSAVGSGPSIPLAVSTAEPPAAPPFAHSAAHVPPAPTSISLSMPLPSSERSSQKTLFFVMGGVVAAALLVGGAVVLLGAKKGSGGLPGKAAPSAMPAVPAPTVDPESGFDITTDPIGAKIKLDGNMIGAAPLKVRNLLAGLHKVVVEGPPGFRTKELDVVVKQGMAEPIHVRLDALEIVGKFTSEPPGARVTLIADGQRETIGTTPVDRPLDPRKRYDVVFEKDGYVTATKPIVFGADPNLVVAVVLEKAQLGHLAPVARGSRPVPERGLASAPVSTERKTEASGGAGEGPRSAPGSAPGSAIDLDARPAPSSPPKDEPRETPRESSRDVPKEPGPAREAAGKGVLMIGAKPQCRIFIDGRDTGLFTPQRNVEVPAGSHKITLVNNEFNIKESYTVDVKAGETVKVIKDFTDRLPR